MKTILFDLDGTLIDSTEAILESFDVAYQTFGHKSPEHSEIKKLIGHPLDIMFCMLGVSQSEANTYVDAYKEHYRIISRKKTFLLPLGLEAIQEASKIATLGVVTTKTARYSQELLEHMNVMHYFEVLIGRESVQYPKPHPEPILKALNMLQKSPTQTWMVGDTPMDLIAAKNAGVESVGVLCGYSTFDELKKHTKYVVNDAFEAVKIISSL